MQWAVIIASAIEAITRLFDWLGYHRIRQAGKIEAENEILEETAERIHEGRTIRANAPDDADLLRPPSKRRKKGGNQ